MSDQISGSKRSSAQYLQSVVDERAAMLNNENAAFRTTIAEILDATAGTMNEIKEYSTSLAERMYHDVTLRFSFTEHKMSVYDDSTHTCIVEHPLLLPCKVVGVDDKLPPRTTSLLVKMLVEAFGKHAEIGRLNVGRKNSDEQDVLSTVIYVKWSVH